MRIRMEERDDGKTRGMKLGYDDEPVQGARIKVIGVGGGGSNAVNRMIASQMVGVEFLVANTDCQALKSARAPVKVQIGGKLTKGLGAGSNPETGRQAALEDTEKLLEVLHGSDMVFITTGLGGGTGTGATPIVANLASELGALVVAVVTKPFLFEGRKRREVAEMGLRELRECVDTVISIPNERLLSTVDRNTSLQSAFLIADDVLRQAVQGISDLITIPGEINLDFADVKTIMSGMGMALMGTGIATGENRAVEAAQRAISSPLLEDATIDGARGVLINITGGPGMTLYEVSEASNLIHETAHEEANIIFGTVIDEAMGESIKVTVIATGFKESRGREEAQRIVPAARRRPLEQPRLELESASPAASKTETPLLRRGQRNPALNADVGSYGPNFTNLKDDLDVPTFLRKQMD